MTESPRYIEMAKTIEFYRKKVLAYLAKDILAINPYINESRVKEISNIILYLNDKIEQHPLATYNRYMDDICIDMTERDFAKWLKDTLFACKDYQNLNLSYNEKAQGISVDDESRPMFCFSTRYDVYNEDSWKDDFIDLDAVLQNFMCSYLNYNKSFNDVSSCYNCVHYEMNSNECLNCNRSMKFRDNFNCKADTNRPMGNEYTRWCEVNCRSSKRAICCYDCNDKNTCENRCCSSYFTNENDIHCKGMNKG